MEALRTSSVRSNDISISLSLSLSLFNNFGVNIFRPWLNGSVSLLLMCYTQLEIERYVVEKETLEKIRSSESDLFDLSLRSYKICNLDDH